MTEAELDDIATSVVCVLRRIATPPLSEPIVWDPDYDRLVEQPFLEARTAREARRADSPVTHA